jgi:aminocarboxymuconate-semialdehyde decarboxylase
VLSPNPLTFFSHVDADLAVAFCRRQNDAMAELVSRAPERIAGFAQLPLQDPARAIEELVRCVHELGLLAPYLATDPGRPLDDVGFDDLWSACVELDTPVFLHPVPDGIGGPRRDERLARFDGDLWLGFLYEETLAVSSLVFGGVLDRHPRLDVCISHGGGATSWLAERMEHAARTRPWGGELAEPGAVTERLCRLWWDAHVGGPKALTALIAAFGTARVVAGTNLAGWDQTVDPAFGDRLLASTLDDNARRLLRLGDGLTPSRHR